MINITKEQKQMTDPVICIPRIDNYIKKEYIKNKISLLNLGTILRITETPLRSDAEYKRVFISIKWDPQDERSTYVYNRLKAGDNVKLLYDPPWYWKMVAGR
jgi:hypothetical protein